MYLRHRTEDNHRPAADKVCYLDMVTVLVDCRQSIFECVMTKPLPVQSFTCDKVKLIVRFEHFM